MTGFDDTDTAEWPEGEPLEACLRALSDFRSNPEGAEIPESMVLEGLSDPDSEVRAAACRVAGVLGIEEARDRLQKLRRDPKPAVSDAAGEGLERLDGNVEEPLDPDSIGPSTSETGNGEPEPDSEPSASEGDAVGFETWPMPRGTAAGTGSREDTAGPAKRPKTLWRVAVPGVPIISDSVYIADSSGVHALDPEDGTERWMLPTGEGLAHGGRSPPDAAVGSRLYLANPNGDGGVYAFEIDDQSERWRVEPSIAASTLTVYEGTIYAAGAGRLYAFDAGDGTERWSVDADVRRFGRPSVAGGTVYADGYDEDGDGSVLFALDADDGSERWRVEHVGLPKRPVVGESIYVIDSQGLLALDPATGEERWHRKGTLGHARPVVADGVVYTIDDNIVRALDADDGTQRWSHELETLLLIGGGPYLAADAGSVYVVTDVLTAIDSSDGTERWRVEFEGNAHGGPALADDRLYLGTTEGLYAFTGAE